VVGFESEQADDGERRNREKLNEMLNESNAAEVEAMLDAASEAKEEIDADDELVHEDVVNRGGDD